MENIDIRISEAAIQRCSWVFQKSAANLQETPTPKCENSVRVKSVTILGVDLRLK